MRLTVAHFFYFAKRKDTCRLQALTANISNISNRLREVIEDEFIQAQVRNELGLFVWGD